MVIELKRERGSLRGNISLRELKKTQRLAKGAHPKDPASTENVTNTNRSSIKI